MSPDTVFLGAGTDRCCFSDLTDDKIKIVGLSEIIYSKTNTKDIDSYTRNVKGNQGITASYQAMIMQYRDTVANYTKEIIDELNSLFMGLY